MKHVDKIGYRWVGWNMLRPGHRPKVPLLPSHMNFVGQDLSTAPRLRRAGSMTVADVMTRDVVTTVQGPRR